MSESTETIDTGDVVQHGPSGERWVVAYVEGDRLAWVGWPEGYAALSDCTLVDKATPSARDALLDTMAKIGEADSGRLDSRTRYARQRLASSPESGS